MAAEAAINISSRRGLGSAGLISFPVSEQATTAVESFGKGDLALVVLCIDTSAEIVNLDFTRTSLEDVGAIAQMEEMSRGLVEPRFLLFRWNDGGRILFALTCPSSSKVKERYAVKSIVTMIPKNSVLFQPREHHIIRRILSGRGCEHCQKTRAGNCL